MPCANKTVDNFGNPLTNHMGQEDICAVAPFDKPRTIPQIFPEDDFIGIQHPVQSQTHKLSTDLQKIVKVTYSDAELEAKAMPHLFPYGIGSWKYEKKGITMSSYYKGRLLNYDGRWRQDPHWSFFWFDRHMKATLYQYNIARKIQVKNRTDKLTKQSLGSNSSYNMYGTNVPPSITGSKSYWQAKYLDLLAMTAEIGQPNFFITLTQNDDWDELQTYLKYGFNGSDRNCERKDDCQSEHISPVLYPTEMAIAFFERFKEFRSLVLCNNGPIGNVTDYWWRIEFQKRGGLHVHMVVWCDSKTIPTNAVCAEIPRGDSITNINEIRAYVLKYQIHSKCYPDRCFKGPNGKQLLQCKYGFPSSLTDIEKLDESGVRYLYVRRHPEDVNVVPYNLAILLLWDGHINIQKVSNGGWQMYLAKYLAKSEPSFNSQVDQENMSEPERYLRTRVVGKLEVVTHLLHFNICRSSRDIIYITTDIKPSFRFLKRKHHMPDDENSEDIFYDTQIEKYLERPDSLSELTYPDFIRQYRYANPSESNQKGDILKDKKGRILRKRKEQQYAIPRYHFLLPFGDDQELYYMQLLLLSLPLNSDTIKLSQGNSSQTYMEECALRNILNKEDQGIEILTSAFSRGFSIDSLKELAHQLTSSHWITEDESSGFLNDLYPTFNITSNNDDIQVNVTDENSNESYFTPSFANDNFIDKSLFTKSQLETYDWIQNQFQTKQQVLACITGAAGTGKSYLLKAIVFLSEQEGLISTVMATTGISACLIGGCTIHCFFKMNIYCESLIEHGTTDHLLVANTSVLIIDEFTMMESIMLKRIDETCRKFAVGGNRYKLFGGKHVFLVGDPAQLPAINKGIYYTPQWFHFSMIVLKDVVRQADQHFVNILHKIREGYIDENVMSFLKSCLYTEPLDNIDVQNSTVIVSLRSQRNKLNELFINSLPGNLIEIKAVDTDMNGLQLDDATQNRILSLRERLPDAIHIKLNARVMLTKNISVKDGWVNGTIATVAAYYHNCVVLKSIASGKTLPLVPTKQFLSLPGYSYNVIRQQFSIIPAYAMTVHKVQGLTLQNVYIQLDETFFASGQAYVAISRVKNPCNLHLISFNPKAIFLSSFYKHLMQWINFKNILKTEKTDTYVAYPDEDLMYKSDSSNENDFCDDNSMPILCKRIKKEDNKIGTQSLDNVVPQYVATPVIPGFPLPERWKCLNLVHNCNAKLIDHISHPVSNKISNWLKGLGFMTHCSFDNLQQYNTCGYISCFAALQLRSAGEFYMTNYSSTQLPTNDFLKDINRILDIKTDHYKDLTGEDIVKVISNMYPSPSLNWFDGPLSLPNFLKLIEEKYLNYVYGKCCPIRICIVNTDLQNVHKMFDKDAFSGDHWITIAYSMGSNYVVQDNENPDE